MHICYNEIEVMVMAEICFDCWKKISNQKENKWRYVISLDRDLYEECGQYKRVIVVERLSSRIQRTIADIIKANQK